MKKEVAIEKMKAYCAYQERCQQEVYEKLRKLSIYGNEADDILMELISENFLNEERYAEAYASGKFRIKSWGRVKIKQGLKAKNISEFCIKKALAEIDNQEYEEKLNKLVFKLYDKYNFMNDFDKKGKVATRLMQKGYEPNLIWDLLNRKN